MERSLSVLLPVHNAQSTVAATVEELLEVLPELTTGFEVVVVDDGSTDATIEVADELAAYFPQVSALRHATPRGRVAAVRTALERSSGEILLLKDQHCPLPADEVPRLWRAMDQFELVVGCVGSPSGDNQPAGRPPNAAAPSSFQMAWRRVIEPILESLADRTTLVAALSQRGTSWLEIPLGDCTGHGARWWMSESVEQGPAATTRRRDRPARKNHGPRGLQRPGYSTRWKRSVLGP